MAQGYQTEGAGRILTGFLSGKAQKQKDLRTQEVTDAQKKLMDMKVKAEKQKLDLLNMLMSGQGGQPSQPTQMPDQDFDPLGRMPVEGGVELPMAGGFAPQGQAPEGGGGFGDMFSEDIKRRFMSKEVLGFDPGRQENVRNIILGDKVLTARGDEITSEYHKTYMDKHVITNPDGSEFVIQYDRNTPGDLQRKIQEYRSGTSGAVMTKPPKAMAPETARTKWRNTKTGEILPRGHNTQTATRAGYKEFPKADVDAADNLQIKAMPVIEEIMAKVEELWPGEEGGIGARIRQGFKVQKERLTQDDPRYAAFIDGMNMFTALLARSVSGEVGVLTDNDIKRITKAMPAWNDSPAGAKEKMNQVLSIVQRRIDARGLSWIKLPSFKKGKPSLKMGGKVADPLGIR